MLIDGTNTLLLLSGGIVGVDVGLVRSQRNMLSVLMLLPTAISLEKRFPAQLAEVLTALEVDVGLCVAQFAEMGKVQST
jgi:hypothetical protein